MKPQDFKLTIHMVSSLDGYIAKPDNDIEWLKSKDNFQEGETLTEEEIVSFLDSIDCYLIGANTYRQALVHGWPY